MTVPSTPTFADSMAEHKALKLEINGFKADKETLKRETKQMAEALTAMREEFGRHVGMPALQDAVLNNMREKARKSVEDAKATAASLNDQARVMSLRVQEAKENLAKMTVDLDAKKTDLSGVQSTLEQERASLTIFRVEKEKEIIALSNEHVALQDKVTAAGADLAKFEEEYKTKYDFIVKEEQCLATRFSDLTIYEERLRKKCLELYPEMEIIL